MLLFIVTPEVDDTEKSIGGSMDPRGEQYHCVSKVLNKMIAKERMCGIPVSRLRRNERTIRTTKACLQSGQRMLCMWSPWRSVAVNF